MKLTPRAAWILGSAVLATTCLIAGVAGILRAYVENGGCEVGASASGEAAAWQTCIVYNPLLVTGVVLAMVGLLLGGITTAVMLVAAQRAATSRR